MAPSNPTTLSPKDWNGVARAKLSAVLGREKGEKLFTAVLSELAVAELTSADDLYRFAERLSLQSGFAGAVGGLLGVHAVMHGASKRTTPVPPPVGASAGRG